MTKKKEFRLDDPVELIYLFKSGAKVNMGNSIRKDAMEQIRNWWIMRQDALDGKPGAIHFLEKGTFAGASGPPGTPKDQCIGDHYIFAWSEIVGMWIAEIDEDAKDLELERLLAQREANQALKAQADMIRRQIDHCEKHEMPPEPDEDEPDEDLKIPDDS